MRHPDKLVAKIKGAALAGIPHKVIGRMTGVPHETVGKYANDESRGYVKADETIVWRLKAWLLEE